ncbi:MAG: terminase large subunit [Candidatus Korobacteraceae bacterium]
MGRKPKKKPLGTGLTKKEIQAIAYQNPVVFANDVLSRDLGKPVELDEWQKEVLRSDSRRIILNCCRQSGKSTITALMALHHALHTPKALVIIISNTEKQAKETFRKIMEFYGHVPDRIGTLKDTVFEVEFANKARIMAMTGRQPDSLRGWSKLTLLIVDEASMVEEDAYDFVRPMLAVSEGMGMETKIMLLSTPHGKRGFFFEAWTEAHEDNKPGWRWFSVKAEDCPRITSEFLQEEKDRMVSWKFEQEYHCEFIENISNIFQYSDDAWTDENDDWDFDIGV